MNAASKTLIAVGVIFILAGVIWHFSKGQIPLGKLPGDIHIKRGNSEIFIPIMTCLLLSIVFSILAYLMRK